MTLPTLAYLSLGSNALPLTAGIVKAAWKQKDSKLIFYYLSLATLTEASTFVLGLLGINNLWLLHLYGLLGFLLFIKVFTIWQQDKRWKIFLRVSVLVYAIFWICAKLFLESFDQLPTYSESASGVILTTAAVFTMIGLTRLPGVDLLRDIRFWTCAAVLVNFAGSFPLYALGAELITLSLKETFAVWTVHWLLDVIVNLCFVGTFVCMRRP